MSKMIEDLGFDEAFFDHIERDGRALEAYPYQVLEIVAEYLKLDPTELLYAASGDVIAHD